MNLIPEITKKLGVEIEEKFRLTCYKDFLFWFSKDDLMYQWKDGTCPSQASGKMWKQALADGFDIIKLPWRPKQNGAYYYLYSAMVTQISPRIDCSYWAGDTNDYMRLKIGNCFKTEEEAENHKEEVFDRLTKDGE